MVGDQFSSVIAFSGLMQKLLRRTIDLENGLCIEPYRSVGRRSSCKNAAKELTEAHLVTIGAVRSLGRCLD
jgi:hypothetical protein